MTKERVRYIYRLKPGAGEEYDRVHLNVAPELLTLISEVGITNYTIWRHEEIVVCEFDAAQGFEKTSKLLAASAAQQAWTAKILHLFDQIDANGEPLWLREVFRLD